MTYIIPDSIVHTANMGAIWGRQNPGGPHVDPMNLAIWDAFENQINIILGIGLSPIRCPV